MDSDGGAVSINPSIVYVIIKHNPNNICPTGSSNTPGTTIIQPQAQQQQQPSHQPIIPNTNMISPSSGADNQVKLM
jgi:hypothetical protein